VRVDDRHGFSLPRCNCHASHRRTRKRQEFASFHPAPLLPESPPPDEQSVFFLGPSGVGKSHLSLGLGVKACAAGYGVLCVRAYGMLKRLLAAIAEETFDEVLETYCRPNLLILDEVGNHPAHPIAAEQGFAGIFYELVHQRHRHGATILASNLGVNDWAVALGLTSEHTGHCGYSWTWTWTWT
jgi:DNA replication protein DnaC